MAGYTVDITAAKLLRNKCCDLAELLNQAIRDEENAPGQPSEAAGKIQYWHTNGNGRTHVGSYVIIDAYEDDLVAEADSIP